MCAVHHIANDHGDEHRADVRGKGQICQCREPHADLISDADRQQEQHEALDKARTVCDKTLVFTRHISGKADALRAADGSHRLRAQIMFFNQAACCRATHQRAGYKAECRRRDGNDAAADRTRGLKIRTESRGCAGAADEGDRAAADAQQRITAKHLHHAAAEEILQRDHHNRHNQTQYNSFAALEQSGNADCKADRCKEHDHEDGLQCAVKGDRGNAGRVENTVENRKAQAANQRSRNTISVEQSHLVGDDPAHPEQESA